MLDKKTLLLIKEQLQRLFALNITRSTFREVQNIVLAHTSSTLQEKIYSSFLSGKADSKCIDKNNRTLFEEVIQHFYPLIQIAKDVYEKGEFVNFITSDTLNRNGSITFFNRIRRIDGKEFDFATDTSTSLQLLHHFLRKVRELPNLKSTKKQKESLQKNLLAIREEIERTLDEIAD